MTLSRTLTLTLAVASAALASATVLAQSAPAAAPVNAANAPSTPPPSTAGGYPNKPIKFVVPFPAGSATDNVGRVVAQAMSEALGQPITVDNKAGSNGIIGAEYVKHQTADPYTVLVTTSTTQAANVSLYRKLSYDPVKDFTPIGKIGVTGFVLMVKPDFPATPPLESSQHDA